MVKRNTVIGIGIISIIVTAIVIIAIFQPDIPFLRKEEKPDVRFFDSPTLAEDNIKLNTATNIKIAARNHEKTGVKDVEVHLSVIEGNNWQTHLQFNPITKLGDIPIELGTAGPAYIQIYAKDISGTSTPFKIKLELFANGISTGQTKEFSINIIK